MNQEFENRNAGIRNSSISKPPSLHLQPFSPEVAVFSVQPLFDFRILNLPVMLGVFASIPFLLSQILVLDPSHRCLGVQLEVLAGLIEIFPSRVAKFDYLQLSLPGVALPHLFFGH